MAAVAVAVIVAVAAGAVAWQRGRFGPRLATADALPPSTSLYVSFDLEGLAEFDRLLEAFDDAVVDAGLEPGTDAIDLLNDTILAELGLSTADFESWIGRDVGVALLDLDVESLVAGSAGAELEPPQAVLAASVRDRAGADAFMPRMVSTIEERAGLAMTRDSYAGVELWRGQVALPEGGIETELVMGRSADLMLMATGMGAMRAAIDSQAGDSLRDADAFRRVTDELPGKRAVTLYLGGDMVRGLGDLGLDPSLGAPPVGPEELQDALDRFVGAGGALTLTEAGARIDFVQVTDPTEGAQDLPAALAAGGSSERIPERLPAATIGYFAFGPWDVQAAFDQVLQTFEEFGIEQQLAEVQEATGIDIERDVIAALTGELGVGVFSSRRGPIAASGGPPIGIMALLGLADPDAFDTTLQRLNGVLAEGGLDVDEQDAAGGVLYAVAVPEVEGGIVYGIDGDFFIGTTDADAIAGDKLTETDLWGEVTAALESTPVAFADVGAILDVADAPPAVRRDLAPLRAVAAGSDASETVSRVTVVALVDYER